MITLGFIGGMLIPLVFLVLIFKYLCIAGLVIAVVLIARKSGARSVPAGNVPSEADLERRRRQLELDRFAIENEERRRKLGSS